MNNMDQVVAKAYEEAKSKELSRVEQLPKTSAEKLADAMVRLTDSYSVPPKAISVLDNGESQPFASLGDFSLVIGKAKSKKTFLISMVLAAGECRGVYQEKLRIELPENKSRILWFDTEQSRYSVKKVMERVASMAGVKELNFVTSYSLRPYSYHEREQLIEAALTELNPRKDVGLVVIDGIRDLVADINSPEEATLVSTKLLQWTTNASCHIMAVLHQNKGDSNPRGHLGTELQNKAETVISVTKDCADKRLSVVAPEDCRNKEFEAFAFRVLDDGLPKVVEGYSSAEAERRKPSNVLELGPEVHHTILKETFSYNSTLSYGKLKSTLKENFQAKGHFPTDNVVQDLIINYRDKKGWITHNGEKGKAARYSYTS